MDVFSHGAALSKLSPELLGVLVNKGDSLLSGEGRMGREGRESCCSPFYASEVGKALSCFINALLITQL